MAGPALALGRRQVTAVVARYAPSPTPADNTAPAPTTRDNAPGATAGNNHTRTRSPVSAENAARNLKITKDRGSALFCSINATPILWLTDFLLYLSELQRQLSYHS
jgi:hypothetical protein